MQYRVTFSIFSRATFENNAITVGVLISNFIRVSLPKDCQNLYLGAALLIFKNHIVVVVFLSFLIRG